MPNAKVSPEVKAKVEKVIEYEDELTVKEVLWAIEMCTTSDLIHGYSKLIRMEEALIEFVPPEKNIGPLKKHIAKHRSKLRKFVKIREEEVQEALQGHLDETGKTAEVVEVEMLWGEKEDEN